MAAEVIDLWIQVIKFKLFQCFNLIHLDLFGSIGTRVVSTMFQQCFNCTQIEKNMTSYDVLLGGRCIMMAVECYLRCWKLEGSKKQRDTFYVEPPSSSKLWAQFALLSKHIPAPISRAMAAMRWTSLVFLPVSWACSYVELPWQANSTVRPSYLIARTMELSNLYGTTEYSVEAVPRGDSENGAYKRRGFVEDLWGSLQVLWNMKKLRPWDLVVLPYYPHSQSRLISGNIRYGE